MAAPLLYFFYGTMIAGNENEVARAIHTRLRPLGPARVSGALWAIPEGDRWYPALLTGPGHVHGVLYEASDGFAAQYGAQLDEWEYYFVETPAESLYLREETQVVGADGASHLAQVYRFNQPLPAGALAIAGGDFRAWLDGKGFAAYAG